MKTNSKKLFATFLISATISSCSTTPPPDIEICTSLSDPYDIMVENQQGYCKRSMSDTERTIGGDPWKNKVRTAVIIDFDDFVKLNKWVRKQCAQFSNECAKRNK